ncbi:MAG: hypothetical protein COB85_05550 [Bacteroidetes bacterium]|nr:MAG: hypothetical protein COB85_05550 [Bacteroidota bacterium]
MNSGDSDTIGASKGTTEKYIPVIGKVAENKGNPNHPYYYYLPSNYDTNQVWPVVYCFDSHGRGHLPVTKYKDLAERNGYILIGSNKSKNGIGWEETFSHIKIMTEQVDSQLIINQKRVYALGFSGGARVAVSMAVHKKGIAGVIGCAAGFPRLEKKLKKNFSYLGIVGSYDFNYSEMLQLNRILTKDNINNHLLIFDGKHEWPNLDIMKDGFSWIELNSIRSGRETYHDSLIKYSYHQEILKTDKMLTDQEHPLKLYRQYLKVVNFYSGLINTVKVEQQLEILDSNPMMEQILEKQEDILKQEIEIKKEYTNALTEQSATWWETEALRMKELIASEEDYINHCSYLRVMSHLSLISYLQCDAALKQNDLETALRYIDIFSFIDSSNPDHAYFRALLLAKKQNMNEALNSLNKAIELGFDDMDKLKSEPLFSTLIDQVIFRTL